ncbi:MAG: class F sortase [Dehalococcoidia bacterium]
MNRIALPRSRLLLFGIPVVVLLIIVIVAVGVARSGGSGGAKIAGSPTASSAGLLSEGIDKQQQLDPSLLAARQNANGVSGTNPNAPVPGSGQGDHLIIPSINVNAALSSRVITPNPDGTTDMPNPDGPNDVVWYDFSAFPGLGGRPGVGGNTVLSGHVDYHDYGPAVFWDLGKLTEGSEIIIQLSDGSSYHYSVQWNRVVDPASTSWNDIVAATPQESLTMITCAGTFDSSSRSYDQRRVVWAVRTS